jgi:sRNA-binding carbon storage regulator CsrA
VDPTVLFPLAKGRAAVLMLDRKEGGVVVLTIPASMNPTRVEVLLKRLSKSRSKIGVEAPPHVTIHRSEVQERVDAEEAAAQ